MGEVGRIVNLINTYHHILDEEKDGNDTVNKIMNLFHTECQMETETFGSSATGETEVKELLNSYISLDFLRGIRHIVQSHVVELAQDNASARVSSYVTAFWKCRPVTLSQWTDQVVLVNGTWKFKARKSVDLQKNLELIGDMQLKGKKSYA